MCLQRTDEVAVQEVRDRMTETASRAKADAEIPKKAEIVMLITMGVRQGKSQQTPEPDNGFEVDLMNYL
jgi:hypothetical protein